MQEFQSTEVKVLLFTILNVAFAVASVLAVQLISPAAAGSGNPEIIAYLNGVDIKGFLTLPTFLAKVGRPEKRNGRARHAHCWGALAGWSTSAVWPT